MFGSTWYRRHRAVQFMGTPWTYQQESRRPVCGAPSPERCVVAGVKSDGGCSAKVDGGGQSTLSEHRRTRRESDPKRPQSRRPRTAAPGRELRDRASASALLESDGCFTLLRSVNQSASVDPLGTLMRIS